MVTRTLGRKPLSWPFKVVGWLFVGFMLLVVAAFVAVVGSGMYYQLTRTTSGGVEGMIEEDLVADVSSTDRVVAFLDSNAIEHGPVEPVDLQNQRLWDADPQPGWMSVSGFIRNDGYALELVDVRMVLMFDAEGTLEDWVVWEVKR